MNYLLNDGYELPAIAFGPCAVGYSPKPKHISEEGLSYLCNKVYNKLYGRHKLYRNYVDSVANAFKIGFRFIDYSSAYGNGELILKAMNKAGLQRKDVFITSRVSNKAQFNSEVRDEFFKMLENFNTDYVDLLQFHWPVTDCYLNTWHEIVSLKKEGYVKSVGVANCHQQHIDALINAEGVVPAVNQIEVQPLFTNKELIAYCQKKGILVEAYSPLARFDDRIFRLPALNKIAKKYNKSIAQVILRWDIQNGLLPVVRSFNKSHQNELIEIFDFELTSEELSQIDAININSRVRYNPDNCDFSIL